MILTMEEIKNVVFKCMNMVSQSIEFDSKENELWWFNGYIEAALEIMEKLEKINSSKDTKNDTDDIFD